MRNLIGFMIACIAYFSSLPSFAETATSGGRENVQFESGNDSRNSIEGLLVKPGKGPFSAIIMLLGCSGMLTKSVKLNKRSKPSVG